MTNPLNGAAVFDTPIALDRDVFMRQLIASLGHLNEGILGSDVAGAYVMNVGLSMGAAIEDAYKRHWDIDRPFTVDEYAHVIVDLKQKIHGNFSLVFKDESKVIVETTSCPFDEFVQRSPSLCFMTSSVFGGIAARNFGYAKVELQKRIALGDAGCFVVVHLQRTPEAAAAVGKEYFPAVDRASPDIAEQLQMMSSMRRLRQQLSETSSQWEELVRGAADAICTLATDGAVLFANARWRDLLGVEGEELTGGTLERLTHPDDQASLSAALAQVVAGQRLTGRACRLRHRNGDWRDALISAGPVRDENGRVSAVLCIVRDVTSERQTERLKDDLLSTASHELRTPVTTIKTTAGMLLRSLRLGRPITEEQLVERLNVIEQEADRLAMLGKDLVDVTRLQSGRLVLNKELCDLQTVAAACIERQQAAAGDAPRHLIVFEPPSTPVTVLAELVRLEQVISNLLSNAVKYSPNGGTVTVRLAAAGGAARLSVADQGIGIPEKDLPQLFTPFFRGSNASTRNFTGIGLGLYLCREVLEAHGGGLSVSSVEGQGTVVTMTLPLLDNGVRADG